MTESSNAGQSHVDINQIVTDLNGKADVDLTNTIPTKTFIDNVIAWLMPDYSAGIVKAWNTTHTADTYGWLYFNERIVGNAMKTGQLSINNVVVANDYAEWSDTEEHSHFLPVSKGDSYIATGSSSDYQTLIFYPAKGGQ